MQNQLDLMDWATNFQAEQQERWRKEDEYAQIMKDLYKSDPRDDKTRIQDAKGGLLRDSYHWIIQNEDFRRWRSDARSQLLWIKSDPGKGKTMLLCGIIDELEKEPDLCLSYFFCDATDARLRNATDVMRSLIWLLVQQKPLLISHVQLQYDHDQAGKQPFENENAWEALSKILTSIINDPSMDNTTFVIDAFDQCTTNQHQLLDFLMRPSRVKWLISSRDWPGIPAATHRIWLELEQNQDSISKAVQAYIDNRVDELARLKRYDAETNDKLFDFTGMTPLHRMTPKIRVLGLLH